MSKTKKRVGSDPLAGLAWITSTQDETNTVGLKLSDIRMVNPSTLIGNPINRFFANESDEYFQQLREDIEKRGVLVPLIAKEDNVLLSGHNRLKIAQELNLTAVPVQYVLEPLNEQEERGFVFKDNLLRRQLSAQEKEQLVRNLYADELQKDNRGGDRKSKQSKIKSSNELLISLPEKVEQETGIKAGTVKRILAKLRKEGSTKPKASDTKKKVGEIPDFFPVIRNMVLKTENPLKAVQELETYLSEFRNELSSQHH